MTISGDPPSSAAVRSALEQISGDALASWLAGRRWFADKGREIAALELEDLLAERVGSADVALCIVRVAFRDGDEARYFLPLALVAPGDADGHIAAVSVESTRRAVVDASSLTWFGDWLRDRFLAAVHSAAQRWEFAADPRALDTLDASRRHPAKVMGAEQSNTSLRFGETLIVKLIRRLQPGPNPDEEVLRALAGQEFPHVPRYVGGASWHAEDGATYPIALAQAFVPNEGDGWAWMLGRLGGIVSGVIDPDIDAMEPERLLGRRTGEMHLALSAVPDAHFVPRTARPQEIAGDVARVGAAADEAVGLLRERQAQLSDRLRQRLPEIEAGLRSAVAQAAGFRDEAETARIRVHGDYHLGQTLRTRDEDWVIVDFEGEPARPVAERRRRQSPLKDVAGMLRSFGYARGVAEPAAADTGITDAAELLADWERRARDAFLAGYREAIAGSAVPLAPGDGEAFARAIAAWELDKALYEIAYEARNRPDWIAIPLRALLPDATAHIDSG